MMCWVVSCHRTGRWRVRDRRQAGRTQQPLLLREGKCGGQWEG